MLDFFEFDNATTNSFPTLMAKDFSLSRFGGDEAWISVNRIKLSPNDATRLRRASGRYCTVQSPIVKEGRENLYARLERALADQLRRFTKKRKNILVVGLGNPQMIADSLGSLVVEKVAVTRRNGSGICTLCPSVSGITGIESHELVQAVVKQIRPSLVLAVDSLCSANESRLATAFQMSDAGIVPGSGVGNAQLPLSKDTLGVEVISIGVPLVVYASALVRDANGDESKIDPNLVVTSKDIDALVSDCATVIAHAINTTNTV